MFFRRVKTPGIAHNAYVIGRGGEAIVVDPRRDVDEYLKLARENGLTVKYVLETHRQEDFVLGSAALAQAVGAKVVAGEHELFGRVDIRLRDGERIELAGLTILALHTPGHTPESMSYAVFLPDAPERAWGVFTGDALFIGEAGRTDLPDPDRTAENAALLYDSVHRKILPLGDQALLLPAHGAGSVCGGDIADRDESTLGLERAYNPIFVKSREAFAQAKAAERMPRPPYFRDMEKRNLRGGAAGAPGVDAVRALRPAAFREEMPQGLVIDTRDPEAFAGGHIEGSYNVWLSGLPIFGGWVAWRHPPVFLVLDDPADLSTALASLSRIGIDSVAGMLAGGFDAWRNAGLPFERTGTLSVHELAAGRGGYAVLDVREPREYEGEGHIPDAVHMWVGDLEARHRDLGLKRDAPLAVTCSVGHRAGLAVSILRRLGYTDVSNLIGGMTAWNAAGLPTRRRGPVRESVHR